MYYETQFEEKIEIFNRIIVYEKDENEFDTIVAFNILICFNFISNRLGETYIAINYTK